MAAILIAIYQTLACPLFLTGMLSGKLLNCWLLSQLAVLSFGVPWKDCGELANWLRAHARLWAVLSVPETGVLLCPVLISVSQYAS